MEPYTTRFQTKQETIGHKKIELPPNFRPIKTNFEMENLILSEILGVTEPRFLYGGEKSNF